MQFKLPNQKKLWFAGTCARDLNCRDRDQDQDLSSRDRDETFAYMPETRPSIGLETVSRPRRRDRDHIPAFKWPSLSLAEYMLRTWF